MSLNLLHLRYFYVIAQERSFTRAAKKLRIAQPSLSKMVRILEDHLDRKLLIRSKKEITLTTYGRKAFEYCKTIFESSEELVRVLRDPELNPGIPVAIGTSDVFASRLFPSVLKTFQKEFTDVYPVLQTSTASEVCLGVANRRLSFGLLFYVPEATAKLRIEDLGSIRFHLVSAKMAEKNEKTLRSFIGSREVDEEGADRFPTLTEWRKTMPSAQIRYSSNCIQAHVEMVKKGLGISILPSFIIREELKSGEFVDLMPRQRLTFPVKLVTREDFKAGLETVALLKLIRDACRALR